MNKFQSYPILRLILVVILMPALLVNFFLAYIIFQEVEPSVES
jgi:phage shock protein PspC (stress-responsive transcriptional regulator)